jgi:hypothetical protein
LAFRNSSLFIPKQLGACVRTDDSPTKLSRTREATRIAEWFKARRFDTLVAMVRHSPLRRLFLSGGPPFSEVTDDLTARLYDFFRPEVEQLEFILQRDLSAWKRVAIASEFEAA